jgi:hypothetical protein
MEYILIATAVLKLLPLVISTMKMLEEELGPKTGLKKKEAVLEAVKTSVGFGEVGGSELDRLTKVVKRISSLVDFFSSILFPTHSE